MSQPRCELQDTKEMRKEINRYIQHFSLFYTVYIQKRGYIKKYMKRNVKETVKRERGNVEIQRQKYTAKQNQSHRR